MTREIQAAGPATGEHALRAAYLDLLKLCLCDLAGESTRTVTWTGDRRVFSRELTGPEQLQWRVEGKDWPHNGLSMIGLLRLDDLQACVQAVVGDQVGGDLIEAGSWRGGAAMLMRATLDSLGAQERTVWVADSFQGFPAPEAGDASDDREMELHMSAIEYLAPTLDQVRGYFRRFGLERRVRFVPGFFEETLDGLRGRTWALIRLDADSYRATRLALEALYPGLSVGGYVVVDDYFHPYLPTACRRAVDEFRADHGIAEPVEQIDWNGARWRRESAREIVIEAPARPRAPRPVPRSGRTAIPTDRELQLADEVAELRSRLDALERSAATSLVARLRRATRRYRT